MPEFALFLYGLYLLLAFGVRTIVHRARTGSTGFSGISGAPGSAEWSGGILFVVAIVLGIVAPLLQLLEVLPPIGFLDGQVGHGVGVGLFAGGLLATLLAQVAMGDSWRIGVDETEKTDLVTDGPFSAVRNPIFTGMLPAGLGLMLLAPNVIAVAAFVALVAALEIPTRMVEEPYLLRAHGTTYADYAARTGRFFPGIGRLNAPTSERTARQA